MVSLCGIKFKVHYWPIFIFIWFVKTFAITFAISLYLGHIYWFFPFISDTGALTPESCIFAQLVNIGATFLSVAVYVRYREVESAINCGLINASAGINTASLWLGWISCLGLSVVANFQQNAEYVRLLHFVGALGSFAVAAVYFILQSIISRHYLAPNPNVTTGNFKLGRKTFYFRVVLSVLFLPVYFICTVCGVLAITQFTGDSVIYWTPDDGGFELRLAAVFAEWILVLMELLYIATFTKEFKYMRFREIGFECKYSKIQQGLM
ncbi:DNA damage-regulated autophagy modulator protein 2-like [Agrilus planipennis]|uniref:DNA damage-regulated autophagy modulator protein 2-like n=1 Tax=Agrilus planipennis TaxID=224129 RepID=A0A7F5R282_AGRPL|nr:DNA damage-regulated autophagy modulator protein 2-like [Agrilus planipennis]